MNNFIKRIYIKKQDNLYKFKNDLIKSSNQQCFFKYDLVITICKKI